MALLTDPVLTRVREEAGEHMLSLLDDESDFKAIKPSAKSQRPIQIIIFEA